jgi:hypothetical protein
MVSDDTLVISLVCKSKRLAFDCQTIIGPRYQRTRPGSLVRQPDWLI